VYSDLTIRYDTSLWKMGATGWLFELTTGWRLPRYTVIVL
jgi:hypothetical protein